MRFREYLENDLDFCVGGVYVSVQEVPLEMHEELMLERAEPELLNFIKTRLTNLANRVLNIKRPEPERNVPVVRTFKPPVDVPEEKLKKFKVTLQYPRNSMKAKLGHYLPDVMYVFASSNKEAKEQVDRWVRNKLEPVENDETRRFPKNNYLKNAKKQHLKIKATRSRTWDDLVDALTHVSSKRGELTPLDYFDEEDFKTLLKRAKRKNFEESLMQLGKNEQRLLKRFYFHMAQSPWLDEETRRLLDGNMDRVMKSLGGKIPPRDRVQGEEDGKDDQPWTYWSIFEPKTEEEQRELVAGIGSTKDAFNVAAKFGIAPKDLRPIKERLFGFEDYRFALKKKLFEYLRSKIPLRPEHRVFHESDYNNPLLTKNGVYWDQLTSEVFQGSGGGEFAELLPFTRRTHADESTSTEEMQWLWDFYKQGKPKRMPNWEQWKKSLEYLLEYRDRVRDERAANRDDAVPF